MPVASLAIINPAAGGGRCKARAPAALARLRTAGLHVDTVTSSAPGDATRLAREAYASGVRSFIAVGGDGTAYEIVNGLVPLARDKGPSDRPCLGFLPLGTGNSFLRDFGKGDAEHAISALIEGRKRPCDAVHLCHADGELYSINLISAGFVADVATVANRRYKRLGAAGYAVAVLSETARLCARPFRMRIDSAAQWWQQDVTFVSFCNSRYTAGAMMMAPAADPADGLVEAIIGKAMSRRKLLAAFPRIFSGTHVALPVIETLRAREIEFDADSPLDLMIDGEVERHRPLRLSVLPHALDVSV